MFLSPNGEKKSGPHIKRGPEKNVCALIVTKWQIREGGEIYSNGTKNVFCFFNPSQPYLKFILKKIELELEFFFQQMQIFTVRSGVLIGGRKEERRKGDSENWTGLRKSKNSTQKFQ